MNRNRLSFGKELKLCSKKQISRLFKEGTPLYNYPFKLYWQWGSEERSQVVISVPKRIFKKAVERNLIKRRVREALRELHFGKRESLTKSREIALIYIGERSLPYNKIIRKIEELLNQIEEGAKESVDNSLSSID